MTIYCSIVSECSAGSTATDPSNAVNFNVCNSYTIASKLTACKSERGCLMLSYMTSNKSLIAETKVITVLIRCLFIQSKLTLINFQFDT